jgi:ATP-dependent Clp protease ATP-binding subunit ClpB
MADQVLSLDRFKPEARQIVAAAQALADEQKHAEVTPLHLLARVLERDARAVEALRRAGADPVEVRELADISLRKLPKSTDGVAYVSSRLIDLLERAEREAQRDKQSAAGVEHLMHALAQELKGPTGEILSARGIAPGAFRPHIELFAAPLTSPGEGAKAAAAGDFVRDLVAEARADRFDPVIGRDALLRRALQILERRFKNHPLLVGEPGVGKTAIVRSLAARVGSGDVPTNLVGARVLELDTGALVAGAKLRGEVEARLKTTIERLRAHRDGEVVLVVEDFDALFGQGAQGAGVGELLKPLLGRGEIRIFATTTTDGLKRLEERDASVLRRFSVLAIEPPSIELATEIVRGVAARYEKHHSVRVSEGAIGAAVTLARRYLSDRALPDTALDLLDETASRKRVEVDGIPADVDAKLRRVEALRAQIAGLEGDDDALSVRVRERLATELAQLEPIANQLRSDVASRRGVVAALEALRKEVAEAERAREQARKDSNFARLGELEHVTLPDLNKRLSAATEAAGKLGGQSSSNLVDEGDIAATLADWTGIPVAKMLEGEAEKLLKMEERLAKRVVGQDEPVRAIAKAVRRGRVGLRDPGKPIGSFLFLGPSGVGKTELAKALAEFLFDDEAALTRLDMSEFMERHMAQRLIGAPPGYADSEQGGFLTEAARKRPFSVLLFDEVEKAHADVFNLLLQVLDDGRLTDGRGRTADFSNTVVIMTSNIGSKRVLEADPSLFETPDGREALRDVLFEELRAFFRPELLNRIDDIIVFKPLSKGDLRGIVDIQLRRLERLLESRELRLELTEAAKTRLVDLGYEPQLGARPLKRAILKELQNPLAEAILSGHYAAGRAVLVDLEGERFVFR